MVQWRLIVVVCMSAVKWECDGTNEAEWVGNLVERGGWEELGRKGRISVGYVIVENEKQPQNRSKGKGEHGGRK